MKKLVVLSGAGISAESGISTFRDAGGLWEGHEVTKVASPEGWNENPALVLDFYNQRRRQIRQAKPNKAHQFLATLEHNFHVEIVTQNVDDLHERGGSTRVTHLHGEILKAQSTIDPQLVYPLDNKDIELGDCCELGGQLRPFIVWFGEQVPMLQQAALQVSTADALLIIGTSLQVYPAAGLVQYCRPACQIAVVDPKVQEMWLPENYFCIAKTAVNALPELEDWLKTAL
ncbi:NAD-dependent deacylase [bacterium]|nr:NAD-dependent deacylase [bacterium]